MCTQQAQLLAISIFLFVHRIAHVQYVNVHLSSWKKNINYLFRYFPMLNSVINPFIYSFCNPKFRSQARRLLTKVFTFRRCETGLHRWNYVQDMFFSVLHYYFLKAQRNISCKITNVWRSERMIKFFLLAVELMLPDSVMFSFHLIIYLFLTYDVVSIETFLL